VYDEYPAVLADLGIDAVHGILFDLGVSSLQLDRVERGFSYSKDAPLDMRMDATSERTAATILATYSELDLRRIFYDFGDEKLAPRYASRIVQQREERPLTTSAELVELIIAATPAAAQRAGHPAKRVFQALRIEVNEELSVLDRAIPAAVDSLAVGGRIVVLSYQSLEDRIVKRALQSRSRSTAPAGLPVELPQHRPELKLLVRGAELATEEEKARNPRATPVRLRAAERLRPLA
jgi:16S rRNA (cytosine1402-N4)-methyltransferase